MARRNRYLDVRIPLPGGIDLRLVERPGRLLDDTELCRLVWDLRDVADRSVANGRLRYGILSGSRPRLERAMLAVVYDRRRGVAVGFNAMSWLGVEVCGRVERVLHAGLCMVAPEVRSQGLSVVLSAAPPLLAFLRGGLRGLWMTNVTQVPAVAGVFAASLEGVYPSPGCSLPPTPAHRAVAAGLLARHRAVFGVGDEAALDAERFVIRNAYTGGSDDLKKPYAEVAKHRDGRFNRLCLELLDYDRGDDLLQVGRLTVGHAARVLARAACRVVPAPSRALRPSPALRGLAVGEATEALR